MTDIHSFKICKLDDTIKYPSDSQPADLNTQPFPLGADVFSLAGGPGIFLKQSQPPCQRGVQWAGKDGLSLFSHLNPPSQAQSWPQGLSDAPRIGSVQEALERVQSRVLPACPAARTPVGNAAGKVPLGSCPLAHRSQAPWHRHAGRPTRSAALSTLSACNTPQQRLAASPTNRQSPSAPPLAVSQMDSRQGKLGRSGVSLAVQRGCSRKAARRGW